MKETQLPTLLLDPYTNNPSRYVACSEAQVEAPEKNYQCLHDITIDDILSWREKECRLVVATRGDCHNCAHSPYDHELNPKSRKRIEEKIEQINERLQDGGISGVVLHWLDECSWLSQKQAAEELSRKSQKNELEQLSEIKEQRRQFFKRWFPKI